MSEEEITEEHLKAVEKELEPKDPPAEPPPAMESDNLIDKANDAAERLEEATAKMNASIQKMQRLKVEQTLAGRAQVSEPKKELTKEEKITQGAKKYLEGTGFEDLFD